MKNLIFSVAAALVPALCMADGLKAFPTAEGYGKFTIGGRGGDVYEVTNLNDSGEGSLRHAVEAEGPRTVVFRVSGTIDLKKKLTIRNPYITIAGQTAPGDGICIKRYPLSIAADEVIIRYIRVRLGNESGGSDDALSCRRRKNIILDHVSASWSIDETMSVYHCKNVTIQWCMITESLFGSNHVKGSRGDDDYGLWYVDGNVVEGNGAVTRDNWNGGVQPQGGSSVLDRIRLGKPWDAMKIDEQAPHEAYEAVLDRAGCSLPVRDAVDRRIVAEVRSGTATFGGKSYSSRKDAGDDHVPTGIIDSQQDVGGWPELKSAAAPADSDHDGMPDAWEREHGLDPANPADRNGLGSNGYTNLENYLNSIAP